MGMTASFAAQIVDVPVATPAPKVLCQDEEWLAVLRETHGMMNLRRGPTRFPTAFDAAPPVAAEHRAAVATALDAAASNSEQSGGGGGKEQQEPLRGAIRRGAFVQTVDAAKRGQGSSPTGVPRNPQTAALLALIERPWNLSHGAGAALAGTVAPLTGADLLEDGGAASTSGGGAAGGDPMFDAIEIHNMDPFAFSNSRDATAANVVNEDGSGGGNGGTGNGNGVGNGGAKRPKLSAMLAASGDAAAAASDADRMDVDASAEPSLSAQQVAAGARGAPVNPEELDIGSDSDDA